MALTGGKTGTIYLIDRDNLGHYNPNSGSQIVQTVVNTFPGGTYYTGNFKAPVYWNGHLYFSADADYIKSFQLTNGLMSTIPTSSSSFICNYPGATLGLSANGTTNAILWAIQRVDLDPVGGGVRGPDRSMPLMQTISARNCTTPTRQAGHETFSISPQSGLLRSWQTANYSLPR